MNEKYMTYSKLLEPGYIGNVKIKNRLIMSPMKTHFTTGDPSVLADRYYMHITKIVQKAV